MVGHKPLIFGIDLGGTYLRSGIVTSRGELLHFQRDRINPNYSSEEFIDLIYQQALATGQLSEVDAVGIALAGTVLQEGSLKPEFLTIQSLGNSLFVECLAGRLNKTCYIGNDGNLALLGEAHFGAARSVRNVLLLTLGTNIGGGLLLDGNIWEGKHSSSSEIGLTLVGDPKNEALLSIESIYSPGAIMQQLNKEYVVLFDLINEGDLQAKALTEEMFRALGVLVTNIHLLLDLDLVIISGGLAKAGEVVRKGIEKEVIRLCPPQYRFGLKIQTGMLPADAAGVIGAACLCLEHFGILPSLYRARTDLRVNPRLDGTIR